MADPIDTTIKAEWTNADALDLQPTCNQLATDTISRQDAVSRFSDLLMIELRGERLPTWEEVYNAIKELPSAQQTTCKYWDTESDFCALYRPSAQPEQRWIPVTERLPDLWDERYLVSLAWGGVGTMEYKSTGFHNYGSFSPVPIETVTAWMPLPEPYKAERRTDETD